MNIFNKIKNNSAPQDMLDASISNADPFLFKTAYMRLAWAFRLSVITNISLVILLVVSINAFTILLPLKNTEFLFIRGKNIDDIAFKIDPLNPNIDGFTAYLEQTAARYVKTLLEIDSLTQQSRLAEATKITDVHFIKKFKIERIDNGEIQKIIDAGVTREIIVEGVSAIHEGIKGIRRFSVNIIQKDKKGDEVLSEKPLFALVEIALRPQTVTQAEKQDNPLGIFVTNLILKERQVK